MDNPDLIDKYDAQLRQIMLDMRHDGIRHKVIHDVFETCTKDLKIMAIAEGELNPVSTESLKKAPEIR